MTHYEIKRGPNRARLYHRYRRQLLPLFRPNPRYSRRTEAILADYLASKTLAGEAPVVVAVYLEAEDWEDMKRLKKVARSNYVASAVSHFRMQYNRPTFLIRCSNYVWCLQRFKPDLEATLLGPGQALADIKVFFPDKVVPPLHLCQGLVWKYVDDFSLVAGANHSVVLRSHMAWWMAYCSAGTPTIPDMEGSILGNVRSLQLPWLTLPF